MWSVTELTRYLRELLEADEQLQDVWVQGEVSNFSRPASGHIYFTLKDASASLRCVMWRTAARSQALLPHEGDAVRVHGIISVYEAGGQYQLYADMIRPAGEGVLYQEFLRLKDRLEAEGLFEPARKRSVPEWPRRIGIVTSASAAALRDILNTLQRRYPLVEVILAPTPVQGSEAPQGIVDALQSLNKIVSPDVIILARGGGSIEDLWAFNDERVARAIIESKAPVITGIGHETDFTIADFVSDLRAPTPTAAAELSTPNRYDLQSAILDAEQRLERTLQSSVDNQRWTVGKLGERLRLQSPRWRILSSRQQLDELLRRASLAVRHFLTLQQARSNSLEQRLSVLSPTSILDRGYAVVSHTDGRPVRSVAQVASGDALKVRVSDGEFPARVSAEDSDVES